MYLPLIHYTIHAEMRSDRLRRMQHQSLIDAIERDRRQNNTTHKVVGWLGTQMIAWGTKLQGSPSADIECQETAFVSITAHS